jgi:hypothetical protein
VVSLSEKVYAGRTEKLTEQELKDKIQEKWAEIYVAETRKSIGTVAGKGHGNIFF